MASDIRGRLGKRIRQLRMERGWRQIDLAAHAELSKTHICDLETGKREVGLEALERIAKGMGIKLSDLIRDVE